MTILHALTAAAALAGASADAPGTLVRLPKAVVFAIERIGDKTVLRCAPGQQNPACDDLHRVALELDAGDWRGLVGPAQSVLRRRDETSEGASFLFEPLNGARVRDDGWGWWTIELYDARSAQPGLQPLSAAWPAEAGTPELLERIKYLIVPEFIGYEKRDGRVTRVFRGELEFARACASPFDPRSIAEQRF